ncbi:MULTISPECIES: hypothetical protein [unclassified Streptomyces]|uniref:hypothetical protein n=1 Tax=unclassified Streptomyces TaxID=2593676 RepID=UPI0004C50A50|nr:MULTISPECIES: hypothetical protein [unclassified Streptomyces]
MKMTERGMVAPAASGSILAQFGDIAPAPVRRPCARRNRGPVFDRKLPGPWLVGLSHVDLSRVKVGKDKPDVHRHRRVPSCMFRVVGNHAAGQ